MVRKVSHPAPHPPSQGVGVQAQRCEGKAPKPLGRLAHKGGVRTLTNSLFAAFRARAQRLPGNSLLTKS